MCVSSTYVKGYLHFSHLQLATEVMFCQAMDAQKKKFREEYLKTHIPSMFLVPQKLQSSTHKSSSVKSEVSDSTLVKGLDPKTAKAFLRAHRCMKREKEKKDSKKIKLIEHIPEVVSKPVHRVPKKQCAAKTMSGKPCPFSATQGKFCKKHQVNETDVL